MVHALATFRLPAALFVATTVGRGNPIICKILVVAEDTTIDKHVQELGALAAEFMDWMYGGPRSQAPDWMALDVAQQLESHQALWWAARMTVLKQGPMHPMETMRLALDVLHSEYVSCAC